MVKDKDDYFTNFTHYVFFLERNPHDQREITVHRFLFYVCARVCVWEVISLFPFNMGWGGGGVGRVLAPHSLYCGIFGSCI